MGGLKKFFKRASKVVKGQTAGVKAVQRQLGNVAKIGVGAVGGGLTGGIPGAVSGAYGGYRATKETPGIKGRWTKVAQGVGTGMVANQLISGAGSILGVGGEGATGAGGVAGTISDVKTVVKAAEDVKNGKIPFRTIYQQLGNNGALAVLQYLKAQGNNRDAQRAYKEGLQTVAEQQAFNERTAGVEREQVGVTYAKEMDDLRRSQYMQNLYKKEALLQRGIAPESESSIGASEWGRLKESQGSETEGLNILRKQKLEEIGLGLEKTQMEADQARRTNKSRYRQAYTSFGDVVRNRISPEMVVGAGSKLLF